MFDIIYNPTANKGKSEKAYRYICETLKNNGIEYTTHETAYAGHATEITAQLNETQEETNLIVLGGDGTFNEILNGITDFDKITVGFIPCGTGNDYVKAIKIPMDVKSALRFIVEEKVTTTDFIQIDDKRCLNVAGAGMDVDVLVRYADMKAFSGKIKYYASLIDVLLHLRFHKVELTINDITTEHNVFLVAVGNGNYIGGGMPICPKSDPNDGFIDVVLVNEIKPSKVLNLLLKFLKGKHIDEPCAETYRVKEASLKILDEGKIQIDGEVLDRKELNCKVVSGKLKIFR